MTRATLWAIMILCFSRVSIVKAAGGPTKVTCTDGHAPVVQKIENVGPVLFQCPQDLTLAAAPPEDNPEYANVFLVPETGVNKVATICDACPGATCAVCPTDNKTYQVLIAQLPSTPSKFFFQCEGQSSQKGCFIGFHVVAYNRLGPNSCVIPGSHLKFAVEKPGEIVQFSCGPKKKLQPDGAGVTYNDSCKEEISLPEGTALVDKNAGSFQLTVEKLPATSLNICYVCRGENSKKQAEICEVRIAIAGSQGGAASLGTAARTAAALGLTLAAVAFIQVR